MTKREEVEHLLRRSREFLERFMLELGMLEDAYITSRYVPREFRREDAERLMAVVEEVIRAVS